MRIGAAFLIIVLLYFIAVVFLVHGVEKTFAAPPPEPFEDPRWSIASAIEWNVGLGFSWAFWYGQWTRLAKTERTAYHGTLWGWGILSCTAGIFAALTAIIVGSFDPTDWLVASQIAAVPVIDLAMIIVANVSSIALLIYPMSITFRSRFPNIKWGYVVGIMTLGGVLLELIPGVFDSYGVYLAYIALLTGIYGGVMIGDYLLTRGTYKLRALYNRSIGYRYVGGFNLNALIATVVAVAFYLWTLDPLSWTSANGLFPLITAGIPSYFLAMVLYILLTKSGIFGKAGAYMPGKTIPTPAAVAAVKTPDASIDVKRS
ncbi:MAG: hypothetical protein NXY59_01490 [Aigarchaeota archaeon]|nr:hypothetical protein [Candidatus Pelearchaeum maunauluense]